jgi:hypothetical protein
MFSILEKAVKLLCILIHSVITLLESKQLFHLSNHESLWDVVILESFLEFSPSNSCPAGCMDLKCSHHIKANAPTTLRLLHEAARLQS